MEIIRPSQWITQPWRNGGGVTHEVFRIGPKDSDAFALRLSVADVERAGPFSVFPGIDRWITLLSGTGFSLHRGAATRAIEQRFVPFRFSGDDAIECTLIDGPVRDLNVMGARDVVSLAVSSLGVFETMTLEPLAGATQLLLFVLEGPAQVGETRLEHHELLVTEPSALTIVGPCELLVVWSTPVTK